MWISKYFVYFVIFSVMGWIYESAFCTIKTGKWQNRGFLYGPLCPIYGVGAASITFIVDEAEAHGLSEPAGWQIFLVAFFGSIVLEYVTSYVLEKLFHAYWWDYSDETGGNGIGTLEQEGDPCLADVQGIHHVIDGGAHAGSQTAQPGTQQDAGQSAQDVAQME